ncbi:5-formyltetrahydrofolate cyclo-ligase [invertebrate metagenome]|uniref:5-formyltetrahydrofolate cyclo-ligase n=1 Tax=invertebrate metagenome TaxID=1711999 RepID=A0A484H9K3_9ZZZZ
MLAHRHRLAAYHGHIVAKILAHSVLQLLRYVSYSHSCRQGMVVAGYWPMAGEVDVRPLLRRFSLLGWQTALPVVVSKQPLIFRIWKNNFLLEDGRHNTLNPRSGTQQVVPDVILVPLLAFDPAGFRLGFGAGYYDRTLADLRRRRRGKVVAIGIAFADQEIPRVPRHRYDVTLDLIWRG